MNRSTTTRRPRPIDCPNCGKRAQPSGPWDKDPNLMSFGLARGWFCNSCGSFTKEGAQYKEKSND